MTSIAYFLVLTMLVVVVLRRPAVAVAAVICMFGLEQWGMSSGALPATQQTLVNYLAGLLVIYAVTRKVLAGECVVCHLGSTYWLLAALLTLAFATLAWTPSPQEALEQWRTYSPYLVAVVLLAPLACTRTEDYTVALRWTVLIGGSIAIAVLFVADWGRRGLVVASSVFQEEMNPLAIASMAAQVVLTLALFPVLRNPVLRRVLMLVLIPVCVAVVARSGSRGQMLAMLVALAVAWPLLRPRRSLVRALAAPFLAGILAVVAMFSLELTDGEVERWDPTRASEDAGGRLEAAAWLVGRAWSSPLTFLFGLGNSASFHLFGIYPHIVPLEVLGEEGLVGLGLLTAATVTSLMAGWHALRGLPVDPESRGAVAALVAGVIFHLLLSFKQGSMLSSSLLYMHMILLARLAALVVAPAPAAQAEAEPPAPRHPNLLRPGPVGTRGTETT